MGQYVVAAPRDEDLRLDADLDRDPHDVRLGLLHVKGAAVEKECGFRDFG